MKNFEMYDVNSWTENGLTIHVSKILKSYEISLKKVTKAVLTAGAIVACVYSSLPYVQGVTPDSHRILVSKNEFPKGKLKSPELVESGFWAKQIAIMDEWKTDPNRIDIDIEPII